MPTLATPDFVLARPGFDHVDPERVQPVIDDATALIVDKVSPELDEATPETTPAAVQAVLVSMVRRGVGNPRGVNQESLGDYSYSAGSGSGGVATIYMTQREQRIVQRAVGATGATSVWQSAPLPRQPSEEVAVAGEDITGS